MIRLPPKYSVVPIAILREVLDANPPLRTLYTTFSALLALAWQHKYHQTDALDLNELLIYLHLERRQFYEQKSEMERRRWLRSAVPLPGYVQFYFDFMSPAAEDSGSEYRSAKNRTASAKNRTGDGNKLLITITEENELKSVTVVSNNDRAEIAPELLEALGEVGIALNWRTRRFLPFVTAQDVRAEYRKLIQRGKGDQTGILVTMLEAYAENPMKKRNHPIGCACEWCRKKYNEWGE